MDKKVSNFQRARRRISGRNRERSMHSLTDVHDWLGRWPMQFCATAEVKDLVVGRQGYEVVKIKEGEADTEYLLLRPGP